jgi:hypothetical protein
MAALVIERIRTACPSRWRRESHLAISAADTLSASENRRSDATCLDDLAVELEVALKDRRRREVPLHARERPFGGFVSETPV